MSEPRPRFSVHSRLRSFAFAFSGLRYFAVSEPNAWIHAAATVIVIVVGFYLQLTKPEWCWIILAIISVWTAEALNTAFEFLTDVASPEFHPLAEKAKDVAAGAVLISAIGSVLIGMAILGPYALRLLSKWR